MSGCCGCILCCGCLCGCLCRDRFVSSALTDCVRQIKARIVSSIYADEGTGRGNWRLRHNERRWVGAQVACYKTARLSNKVAFSAGRQRERSLRYNKDSNDDMCRRAVTVSDTCRQKAYSHCARARRRCDLRRVLIGSRVRLASRTTMVEYDIEYY